MMALFSPVKGLNRRDTALRHCQSQEGNLTNIIKENRRMSQTVIDYVLRRLKQLGIKDVFGVQASGIEIFDYA